VVETELTEEAVLREENQRLRQLVADYQAYLEKIAPFSFRDGATAKTLRIRTQAFLGEAEQKG